MNVCHFRITGISPLIMHNGQTADVLNDFSKRLKRVSSKKKKTDADHEEMSRIEFMACLYLHKGEPCIPSEVLQAALLGKGGSARARKMGLEGNALVCRGPFPLQYDGPKDPQEMLDSGKFTFRKVVKQGQTKITRTRVKFDEWRFDGEIEFDPDILDLDVLKELLEYAGHRVGIGDWRPKTGGVYGRFEVEFFEPTEGE